MARFSHPYAVKLLDASLDEPLGPCLVLEFIPGITLETLSHRLRRFTPERAARLIAPLCHALHAAHSAKTVHRDLKPANLMVVNADSPGESVRVMDFGFAGFTSKPHIQMVELTGRGATFACGTPAYVSPEMVRGDAVDGRGDLYSVGVMLFEMLTGRLPFEGRTPDEMVTAHVQKPPPRFHRVGAEDVPPGVEAVVQIALSKYPNERQQNARELCEQLGKALGVELWSETAPPGHEESDDIVQCTLAIEDQPRPSALNDPFLLADRLEAMLPEKLAAAKIRGFVEDIGAEVVASEPGLIRVRHEMPPGWKEPVENQGSRLFAWVAAFRAPIVEKGREPIQIDLQMEKLDPNRVAVVVSFRPLKWYQPTNTRLWKDRCEAVYSVLRKYLMAD
jgi:serine/threonine protein kinase